MVRSERGETIEKKLATKQLFLRSGPEVFLYCLELLLLFKETRSEADPVPQVLGFGPPQIALVGVHHQPGVPEGSQELPQVVRVVGPLREWMTNSSICTVPYPVILLGRPSGERVAVEVPDLVEPTEIDAELDGPVQLGCNDDGPWASRLLYEAVLKHLCHFLLYSVTVAFWTR